MSFCSKYSRLFDYALKNKVSPKNLIFSSRGFKNLSQKNSSFTMKNDNLKKNEHSTNDFVAFSKTNNHGSGQRKAFYSNSVNSFGTLGALG